MDEETRKAFDKLGKEIAELKPIVKTVQDLKKQVSINCTKLDKMDNKLDQLQEIGEKNQNSINELIKLNRQNI